MTEQKLVEKFNRICFKGLENIQVGDALYYSFSQNFSKIKFPVIKAVAKIMQATFFVGSKVEISKDSNILFLFSNSYGSRKDLQKWFERVCDTASKKSVIRPVKPYFYPHNIRQMAALIQWNKAAFEMKIPWKQRLYYLAVLVLAMSDIWYIEKILQKNNIDLRLFVSTCDVHLIDSIMTQRFNLRGIDTASLQHGVISRKINEWTVKGSKSKYYLIYGEYTKKQAMLAGVKEEKLVMLGMPQYIGERFPTAIAERKNKCFGIVLNGGNYIEEDKKMLVLAEQFAEKNDMTYSVKLHPGSEATCYDKLLLSPRIKEVHGTEISIEEFGKQIDFALLSKSVVFMEYMLNLVPVFLFADALDEVMYEGIEWCRVSALEEMQNLYTLLERNIEVFEKNILETRAYLVRYKNMEDNYKKFFDGYIK